MKCVILAAGGGTRLRPLTLTTPKPLTRVAGKPILDHIVDALPASVDSLVLVVSHLKEEIQNYCGTTFHNLPVEYVVQEETLGTAHALLRCKNKLSGTFLVMPGDDIHGSQALERMIQHELALLVAESQDPEYFGVVSLKVNGALQKITEKPAAPESNLISTGVMVLDERIFNYTAEKSKEHGEYFLPDMLNQLAKDYDVAVETQNMWLPINQPEDIVRAEAQL